MIPLKITSQSICSFVASLRIVTNPFGIYGLKKKNGISASRRQKSAFRRRDAEQNPANNGGSEYLTKLGIINSIVCNKLQICHETMRSTFIYPFPKMSDTRSVHIRNRQEVTVADLRSGLIFMFFSIKLGDERLVYNP